MSRTKKKKKLSKEEVDELVNAWIASIDELREFFFEHSPEEEKDVFYDKFLETFQKVEQLFQVMVQEKMIVQGTIEDRNTAELLDNIQLKKVKGRRDDN